LRKYFFGNKINSSDVRLNVGDVSQKKCQDVSFIAFFLNYIFDVVDKLVDYALKLGASSKVLVITKVNPTAFVDY